MRDYLEVLNAAFAGPGPVDVENDAFRVHNPLDVTDVADADPARRARAGDAAHRGRARVRDDPVDGRRARDRRARRAAHHQGGGGGRPAARRGSWPASRSRCAPNDEVDAAREWANSLLGHAEYSPNYQRLLEHGDATDVGDVLAAGDESAVVERLRSFRDAGVTDLSVRSLPFGTDREAAHRVAAARARRSSRRSCPEL